MTTLVWAVNFALLVASQRAAFKFAPGRASFTEGTAPASARPGAGEDWRMPPAAALVVTTAPEEQARPMSAKTHDIPSQLGLLRPRGFNLHHARVGTARNGIELLKLER